jgi:hypothetical protein
VLAAGDGEEAWRARLRVPSRGGLIGDDGMTVGNYGGAVERLGHAAGTEMARRRRTALSTAVSKGEGAVSDRGGFQLSGDDDLLTPRSYPFTRARIVMPAT